MLFPSLRRFGVSAAVVLGAIGLGAGPARASERDEMTDLFIFGQFAAGDDTTAEAGGFDFDIDYDDSVGGGVGFGRNVNDYININATLLIGQATVDVDAGSFSASDDATVVAPDINIDWNILDTDVTPFVTAGAGLMMFFSDDNETDLSYGAGAGLRWDISHDTFLKVWYRAKWFELDETDDSLMLHTFNVGIGIMR